MYVVTYRKVTRFAVILFLFGLSACNLQDAQATVFVIAQASVAARQDNAPTAPPSSDTLPEVQFAAQVTPVPAPALADQPVPFADQLDPVLLLASFYNAINLKDYARAYGYWESPPNGATLQQFTQGYADTASVSGLVRLPVGGGGAAGSIYAAMQTALISTRNEGSQQAFSACYVARKSNVPVGDSPTPDPNWRLYDGVATAAASPVTPNLLEQACVGTPYEAEIPGQDPLDNPSTPVTLLESYYNAVNNRDYARAYSYWETPPRNVTLEQFAQGYANTANVDVYVSLDIQGGGAAGSVYVELPALLIATNTDGSQQVYAGCYVTRRSNVEPTPDQNWRLYSASVAQVADFNAGLAQPCIA